ncbi:calmodulin-like [Centruroides sculpturatus]|uniref:calmodulin-like n=1 Tax=Centruroides sculpturatus TaxID=218467 RepID=UPI000C6DDEA6|nr:calmodulin-like [Centruroides sculpturatus]
MEELKEEQEEGVIAEYKSNFSRFDNDGDGVLTIKEFGRLMRFLGQSMTESELQDAMEELNPGGEGSLNFPGFLTLMTKRTKNADNEEEIQKAFQIFDTDKDGFITAAKLRKVMTSLGEKFTEVEISEMIREADTDGDTKISYEDFVVMMTSD